MANPETKKNIKTVSILVAVTAFLSVTSVYTFGLLANQNTMNTTGVVADLMLGVYSDSTCTLNYTLIDWGACYPAENKAVVAYIKNLGTVNATLSLQTSNWNPSTASSILALNTNYLGQTITSDEVIPITFTLFVPSDVTSINTFSFDIIIISTG